jgi:uncharacterized membrane protein YkvA (DUF1232 family)
MNNQDKPELDENALKERVKREAAAVTERDARRLVEREQELQRKYKSIPGKFNKLVNQVKLLFELVRAYVDGSYRRVPWATIATAVAAVVYVLAPIDLIPDVIPGLGYIDDALVVRFALSMLQSDLAEFCEFKGYDLSKYFE